MLKSKKIKETKTEGHPKGQKYRWKWRLMRALFIGEEVDENGKVV